MFTFKPASKHGNGATNGSSNGNGNGHGNGHAPSNNGNGASAGNGHLAGSNGNGHGGWFGRAPARPAAARASNGHSNRVESVLGPGIHFKGTLNGNGGVRIEGTFDGSINVKGPVVIADGARVTADIYAGAVTVGGSLKGNITAAKVEIQATGRVWGDLVTSSFATDEGAFLRGQVRMEDEVPLAEMAEPEAERVPERVTF
jgi:cytoskeletal protein CcmA (bactofilin family)